MLRNHEITLSQQNIWIIRFFLWPRFWGHIAQIIPILNFTVAVKILQHDHITWTIVWRHVLIIINYRFRKKTYPWALKTENEISLLLQLAISVIDRFIAPKTLTEGEQFPIKKIALLFVWDIDLSTLR